MLRESLLSTPSIWLNTPFCLEPEELEKQNWLRLQLFKQLFKQQVKSEVFKQPLSWL